MRTLKKALMAAAVAATVTGLSGVVNAAPRNVDPFTDGALSATGKRDVYTDGGFSATGKRDVFTDGNSSATAKRDTFTDGA